jgi:hypothetical protein
MSVRIRERMLPEPSNIFGDGFKCCRRIQSVSRVYVSLTEFRLVACWTRDPDGVSHSKGQGETLVPKRARQIANPNGVAIIDHGRYWVKCSM